MNCRGLIFNHITRRTINHKLYLNFLSSLKTIKMPYSLVALGNPLLDIQVNV